MAKNMSKSCLKAMFAVLAAICLVLWGIGMSGNSFARAEGESPWITAYDPTHTYTAKDDEDILTYVQGVVRNRYGELQTASGVVLDKDEYALVSASAETEALRRVFLISMLVMLFFLSCRGLRRSVGVVCVSLAVVTL